MSTSPTEDSYHRLVGNLKCWIVLHTHKHGTDAWPIFSTKKVTRRQAIESAYEFRDDRDDEWIELLGPFDIPS